MSAMVAAVLCQVVSYAAAPQAKYVFYMIGDGMGINAVYGAQTYNRATGNGPENINFFQFPVRTFVTTYSASSLVTDSAAAGTALSTGVKTYNDGMGVDADGNPVSNVAEWAKSAGFGIGVATTVGVNHATPAAFYAHTASRGEYEKIVDQYISSEVDFAAGGGLINERRKTGHDSAYLEKLVSDAGITILRGESIKTSGSRKERVLCLGNDAGATDLPYAIDCEGGDAGLSGFVQAGIDYLMSNYGEKGFFFMVEGGSIDHAGHGDDAAAEFWEVNDFARSIDVALSFYEEHPDETVIIVTADHETGGLMPGAGKYEMKPELLGIQTCSEDVINREYRAFLNVGGDSPMPSWDDAKAFFAKRLGLWDTIEVDSRTEASLKESFEKSVSRNEGDNIVTLYSVSTRLVSDAIDYADRQAGYSYAHGTHTGSPVGLYVKGTCAEAFLSCTDNTDIPKTIARIAGYAQD